MIRKSSRLGFSMVELLVVTTIIIVLTSIGLVSYSTTSRRTRDGKRQADIAQVQSALEIYRSINGNYPAGNFTSLMGNSNFTKFMSSRTVQDPSYPTKTYTYSPSGTNNSTYQLCYTNEALTVVCVTNP